MSPQASVALDTPGIFRGWRGHRIWLAVTFSGRSSESLKGAASEGNWKRAGVPQLVNYSIPVQVLGCYQVKRRALYSRIFCVISYARSQ